MKMFPKIYIFYGNWNMNFSSFTWIKITKGYYMNISFDLYLLRQLEFECVHCFLNKNYLRILSKYGDIFNEIFLKIHISYGNWNLNLCTMLWIKITKYWWKEWERGTKSNNVSFYQILPGDIIKILD